MVPFPSSKTPFRKRLGPTHPAATNGDPYPSLVLEVGNSQSIPDIIGIRNRMLSWRTSINVFVLIAYNRNTTRANDTWFLQIAVRDYFAPQPPPGTGTDYPACIVLYETPKIGPRYPKVDNPLAQGTQVYHIDTRHLYHPEPPPSSTLLSRYHLELMSRKFARPLSIVAAHKWSGDEIRFRGFIVRFD